MSEDTIDYKKLAEALAEALEQRNLWIEGEEYRELVILRMRLSKKVESLAEELEAANARIAELEGDNAELKERVAMLDVTAVYKSLGEMGYIEKVTNLKAENAALQDRIAELEAEVTRLLTERDDAIMAEARYIAKVELAKKDARIAELEEEPRWIPVSERLPEAYEKVIALAKDCMNVDWVLPKELREVGKGAFARLYNVTHWMPLPTPPEADYGIR